MEHCIESICSHHIAPRVQHQSLAQSQQVFQIRLPLLLRFHPIQARYPNPREWLGLIYHPIFPDYVGVTIPVNIAPLNFMIEGVEHLEAIFMRDGAELLAVKSRKGVVDIPIAKWRDMLQANAGASVEVTVRAWGGDNPEGVEYAPFEIFISQDKIDDWVSYRLIEPGYEGWLQMGIYQRELSSFNEEVLVDNSVNNMGCVNCHSFCASFYQVRAVYGV